MKGWVQVLLFLGLGIGIGFCVGNRYGQKKAEEAYEKQLEDLERTSSLKENVKDEAPPEDVAEKIVEKQGYISADQKEETLPEVDDLLSEIEKDVDKYLGQFESPPDDDPADMDDEDVVRRTVTRRATDEYIEPISEEEYESETAFNRMEYLYYEEDEVVANEDGNRLEDPDEVLGSFALSMLDRMGIIYIRNSWTETVYQVTKIHNAYGRVVLGIDDDYEMYQP